MFSNAPVPRTLAELPVFKAADLKAAAGAAPWHFDSLVGILAEISEETACGAVSFLSEIILEAQGENEPVAWVAGTRSLFFPPDLCMRGVDLSSLAVVRAGGEAGSLTAAEWLVRSGAMGLVVVDVEEPWNATEASLGRIHKLAERSLCAVVFLTRKRRSDPSLGSRISLRACITRSGSGPFLVHIQSSKDKRSTPGRHQTRRYHGPAGMH